jgi:hypothetical protein
MKRQHIGAVLAGAAFAALACRGDPTASLRGGAKFVDISASVMFIDAGSGKPVSVVVRDEQQNPLAVDVTVNTVNAAVATVVADTTIPSPNGSEHNFIVTGVAPGQTKLVVQGGGVSDTATINVLPLAFGGAASTASPQVGQPFTLLSTGVLKWDTTSANIDFGSGIVGEIIRASRDTLKVYVPQPDATQPQSLKVNGVAVTYVSGLILNGLPVTGSFTVTNPFGSHNSCDPAASVMPIPGTIRDGFASTEVDHYYTFTLAGTTTITFTVSFPTGADLDLYVYDVGCTTFQGGTHKFDAAGSNNPETVQMTLPAGSYQIYVNVFDPGDGAHLITVTTTTP